MQRSLDRFGVVDVDRIFNSGLTVRCPECGQRFVASVQRKPDAKHLHPAQAVCPCGAVEARGSVVLSFYRVPQCLS